MTTRRLPSSSACCGGFVAASEWPWLPYDYCPTVPGKPEYHGCPEPTVVVDECTGADERATISVGPHIAFLPNTDVLTLPSRVPLQQLARTVAENRALLVAINVGDATNADRELAQRRADALARLLHNSGINVDNISVLGFGAPASTAGDDPAHYPVTFERGCPENIPSVSDQLCKKLKLGGNHKIQYKVNSTVLQPASKEILKRDVAWSLKAHPQVRVQVQGHTSSEGKLEYNMKLSRRRQCHQAGVVPTARRSGTQAAGQCPDTSAHRRAHQ